MQVWIMLIATLAVMALLYGVIVLMQRITSQRWLRRPLAPGQRVEVGEGSLYVTLRGEGSPTVLIETASGNLSLEWWPLQEKLASSMGVVTYDRGGMGWSDPGVTPRSSAQINRELESLLQALGLKPPFLLVGHSIGGLYMQHFARLHPEWVVGMVLVDPLTLENRKFDRLQARSYPSSPESKVAQLRRLRSFAGRGLMQLLRRKLQNSGQWEPLRKLPEPLQHAIFAHYCLTKDYDATIDELQHLYESIAQVRSNGPVPDIPVVLIHHHPQTYKHELTSYGLNQEEAARVEAIWEETHRALLKDFPRGEWIQAARSGHSDIHLQEPEIIAEAVRSLCRQIASASQPEPAS